MDFNSAIGLDFHGAKITSDAGMLAKREVDGAWVFAAPTASHVAGIRMGNSTQHSLTALLR